MAPRRMSRPVGWCHWTRRQKPSPCRRDRFQSGCSRPVASNWPANRTNFASAPDPWRRPTRGTCWPAHRSSEWETRVAEWCRVMRSSVSAARRFRDCGRCRTHNRKTNDVHGELASQQFQPLLMSPLEFRPLGGERGRTCRGIFILEGFRVPMLPSGICRSRPLSRRTDGQ